MYCHEAFRCPREDCPVRRRHLRRCWEYFGAQGLRVTLELCPYAPCDRCHYRMGWEIGLIGDSLFTEDELAAEPSAAQPAPLKTADPQAAETPNPETLSVENPSAGVPIGQAELPVLPESATSSTPDRLPESSPAPAEPQIKTSSLPPFPPEVETGQSVNDRPSGDVPEGASQGLRQADTSAEK
ncbi:MAG TPA: hypothetical protein PKO06_14390, partial [Candidatus Ozemobacteraceae bacterium]|nr:hypothetical protein [Candidatus Ozemobacteraceae bacterium]